MLGHRRLTTFLAAVIVADTIQTLTNAQKLSLSPATAVGTQVKVSDGFVVSGTGNATDGFYFKTGTENGKDAYAKDTLNNDATINCRWSHSPYGVGWIIYSNNEGALNDNLGEDVLQPWQSASWTNAITLTHPAVQQLASPSSAQGGVFVSGGTQDGIYSHREPDYNGKQIFGLLGITDSNVGAGLSAAGWGIWREGFSITSSDGTELYYSLSNVATPDLASNWKNASDDSPAFITVTSVTSGQIAAGIKFGSNFYTVTTPVNGRNAYHDVLGVAPDFTFNGTIWTDGTHNGVGTPAFPWSVTGITITQDNVAAEANWSNV